MEPKTTGKQVHITMGSGYPKDGSVLPVSLLTPKRRLVSKIVYIKVLFAKTGLNGLGLVLMLSASIFIFIFFVSTLVVLVTTCGYFGNKFMHTTSSDFDAGSVVVPYIFCIVSGVAAKVLSKLSSASLKKSERIEPVVPISRANTADLPASESLVRASEQPLQAQEAVLLRAASEGTQTPPEQLMRAVNRQKEP